MKIIFLRCFKWLYIFDFNGECFKAQRRYCRFRNDLPRVHEAPGNAVVNSKVKGER